MTNITGIIYLIINEITKKLYIGKTVDFKRRMREHQNAKSKFSLLHKSIRKYGWENFSVIKLHEDVPLNDLEWLERHCILIWNTMAMDGSGYNLRFGGNRGLASEETKQKISKTQKEKINKNKRNDVWIHENDIIKKYQKGFSALNISNEYNCRA